MVSHVYRVNTGYRLDICCNISAQFVEIKCAEHDHTFQTVNTEFETTTSRFSKMVTNTCFHHVYNINTRTCPRVTWTHARYSLVEKCPVAEPT